jgi:hypothetical protein
MLTRMRLKNSEVQPCAREALVPPEFAQNIEPNARATDDAQGD